MGKRMQKWFELGSQQTFKRGMSVHKLKKADVIMVTQMQTKYMASVGMTSKMETIKTEAL